MSYNALKSNLERIIKEGNHPITDLERKAGLRKNSIYNIIKGISKKPSAEALHAIAKTLNVDIDDLLNDKPKLNLNELSILEQTMAIVLKELIREKVNVTIEEIFETIRFAYEYSITSEEEVTGPDTKFIKWYIQQKHLF